MVYSGRARRDHVCLGHPIRHGEVHNVHVDQRGTNPRGSLPRTEVGEGPLGRGFLHDGGMVAVAGLEKMTAPRLEMGLPDDVRDEEDLRADLHEPGSCRQRRRGVERRWIPGWR